MLRCGGLAAFGVLSATARASTASPETIVDVQCVVVGARLSMSSDQRQQKSGEMLLVYFLGRIEGRSPKLVLEPLIEQEAKKMTDATLSKSASRCAAELSARGAEIAKIGRDLESILRH